MFHGGALQKLFLATIKVCCVRQLEKTEIACRNDKNLLCALGLTQARGKCVLDSDDELVLDVLTYFVTHI